ncbi:MAG: hypothetical protein JKY65_05620 [Planctomycetes bacterium]|nr:hypothetical protein [Planctomycetota bacterium]
MRFIGQGVAVGVTAPEGGTPAAYIVARMDLEGLAADLAVNGDWQEVWGKLSALLQGSDGKAEEYKGYQIVARPMKEGSKHNAYYSQVDRYLIAATDRAPVAAFIDIAKGEAEGLAKHPGWSAVEALDAGEDKVPAFAWVDPGFWRDGARVRQALIAISKINPDNERNTAELEKNVTGKELDRFAKETKPLEGLALGLATTSGGTYDWRFISSHTAKDVFTVADKPINPAAMAGADPALFVSCSSPYVPIAQFLESKGWKTIAATEAVTWLSAQLDDPEALVKKLEGVGAADQEAREALKKDPRFEVRSFLAISDLFAPELLGERWSLNVAIRPGKVPEGQLPVDGAAAITLRPALRGVAAVVLGALEVHAEKVNAKIHDHAGVKIYTVKGPQGDLCFALIGANLIASLSKERLEAAIAAGQSGKAEAKLAKLLAQVPEGCEFVSYYNTGDIVELMEKVQKSQRRGRRDFGGPGGPRGPAAYVPKAGNEAAAVGALKAIMNAQTLFREGDKDQDNELDYASNLAALGKTKLIDSTLASGTKQGYTFEVCRGEKDSGSHQFLWMATASPAKPGTGAYFATNHQGVVFQAGKPFALDPKTCEPQGGTPVDTSRNVVAGPTPDDLMKLVEEAQQSETLFAIDVKDDWTAMSFHVIQGGFSDRIKGYLKGIYPAGATLDDATLGHLPAATFLGGAISYDPQRTWKGLMSAIGKDGAKMLADGKEKVLGDDLKSLDPETQLLPHFGKTFGIGLSTQPVLVPKDAPPEAKARMVAVPALTAFMTYTGKDLEPNVIRLIEVLLVKIGEAQGKAGRHGVSASLRSLFMAQMLFREGDKDQNDKLDYAKSVSELAQYDLVDWGLTGNQFGYRFKVKRSTKDPENSWIAVATPLNGVGIHYAITHEGNVVHSYKAIPLTDTSKLPEHVVAYDVSLGEAPKGMKLGGTPLVSLAKATIGGKPAYRLVPEDKKLKRKMSGPAGAGISPCFSFNDGVLYIASSEHALGELLSGKAGSLASAPRFTRMRKRLGVSGGSVMGYFHVGGLIDQILANGELIVMEAAPTPPELNGSPMPEYPDTHKGDPGEDGEARMKAQQKAEEAWQKEQQAWSEEQGELRKKKKEWRKTHAAENKAKLAKILGSLRVLGGGISTASGKDGTISSTSVLSLDPEAASVAK